MKKLILKTLKKKGLSLVKSQELEKLVCRSSKSKELVSELRFSMRDRLPSIPPIVPENINDCLTLLIGTSPFEGLSILNALYSSSDVPGSVCEMGVAQGATTQLIGSFLMSKESHKELCIFDSFQGLSEPTEEDALKNDIYDLGYIRAYGGLMSYGKEHVLSKLAEVSFPRTRIHLFEGFIDDVVERDKHRLPAEVSFAYIDFDLYAPIKTGLEMLESRLSKGSIIIVDDYDFFSTGAKSAVDEFYSSRKDHFTLSVPEKELGHFAVLERL